MFHGFLMGFSIVFSMVFNCFRWFSGALAMQKMKFEMKKNAELMKTEIVLKKKKKT